MKLLLLLLLLACSGLPRSGKLPDKRTDKLSVLQGVTSDRLVEFSVLAPKNKLLRFELRNAGEEVLVPDEVKVVSRDYSAYALHKMLFQKTPDQDYNLYVFEGEKLLDQRLIGRGQQTENKLRLAVASCMSDYLADSFPIWDELSAKNPEYLLLIGDNVYADQSGPESSQTPDAEIIWKRYTDVRLTLPLFFQQKLIPTHALWDDHDYGINDGGENFQHKDASKEIFQSFYAQELTEDEFYSRGHGVGGLLSLGDFNLYFLDARYFRSETADGKHLGAQQESWLLSKLSEENSPSLLIKGDQFFGGYHRFESFQGNHPDNFLSFTADLKKLQTPVVFLSGDRHLSEIMQFPRSLFSKPSFEITSSPIHARMYPDSQDVNPWRVVANQTHHNFTIIDNEARENHWFMEVENFGLNSKSLYRRELAVYIKDLQNNLNEVRKKRRQGGRRYKRGPKQPRRSHRRR